MSNTRGKVPGSTSLREARSVQPSVHKPPEEVTSHLLGLGGSNQKGR